MPANELREVSTEYMLFKAKREEQFITGSEAVKEAARRANIDIAIAYPITPQSESMHLVGDLYAEGYVREYFRGENEFAVMSEIAGAAMAGVRTFTATCGPGTLRAFENFPMWSGARLPIVMSFMTRVINAPLSIQPDTIEMSFLLDTGMMMMHAEAAQDLYDMLLMSFDIAEQTSVHIPMGVFVDGFFVTHTRQKVNIVTEDVKLKPYNPGMSPVAHIDMETPPFRLMRDPFVMKSNYISYAAHASWQQEVMASAQRAKRYIKKYLGGFIEHENPDAPIQIVASGTAVSQSREAIKMLKAEGVDAGLIKIKVIRPFPGNEVKAALSGAEKIIIPEFNRVGWLCREVASVIPNNNRIVPGPRVYGGMTMPPEVIVQVVKEGALVGV
ncbi:MAG: transketolase C-terminal domain-containing protein [Candidatus Loosdrechtia sp.]|uniref:transketolase C-terminal domain-containing protein n=1 Tax=Candidatus Loosdrechtia sp. TaxID=3101272 RepID=UPI003A5E1644|nr:MAG: transketolase C-terminal domain-containing protein [Candidatus Jettenia sp. AMX2]